MRKSTFNARFALPGLIAACAATAVACGGDDVAVVAPDGGGESDAGHADAGHADATTDGAPPDAHADGGAPHDSATSDATTSDGASHDGATSDATSSDATTSDATTSDGASSDAAGSDATTSDGASSDAAGSDAGASDATTSDGGGGSDAGASDATTSDGGGGSDAGASDAATSDGGGGSDAASSDGGSSDATTSDGGGSDATTSDGGGSDATTSDGGGSDAPSDGDVFDSGTIVGHVTFRHPNGSWMRVPATGAPTLENMSAELDGLSIGDDDFVMTAPAGDYLALVTDRFGCSVSFPGCLAAVASDFSTGMLLQTNLGDAGPAEISAGSFKPAIAAGGTHLVFGTTDGPHSSDLWATTKLGSFWSAPVLLTGASTHAYHHDASISYDGAKVIFDCGADPYGITDTAICEVGFDGNNFRQLIGPTSLDGGTSSNALHHPSYAPDGTIVFESNWFGEQVWRAAGDGSNPILIADRFQDDNSPCVLPDGRIVSLWLGRADAATSQHELKIMDADGSNDRMLVEDIDIDDIGIACGR